MSIPVALAMLFLSSPISYLAWLFLHSPVSLRTHQRRSLSPTRLAKFSDMFSTA